MSMLEPNDNTILWTQIMAIPRCITRALESLQQGAKNGLPMNTNEREIKEMLGARMQGT